MVKKSKQIISVSKLTAALKKFNIAILYALSQSEENSVRGFICSLENGDRFVLYVDPDGEWNIRDSSVEDSIKIHLAGNSYEEALESKQKVGSFKQVDNQIEVIYNGTLYNYVIERLDKNKVITEKIPLFEATPFFSNFIENSTHQLEIDRVNAILNGRGSRKAKRSKKVETDDDDEVVVPDSDDEIPTIDESELEDEDHDLESVIAERMAELRSKMSLLKSIEAERRSVVQKQSESVAEIARMEKNIENCQKYLEKNKNGSRKKEIETTLSRSLARKEKLESFDYDGAMAELLARLNE